MSVIGSAVVRIVPGMSGFGAAVGAGIAGSAGALTRAGVASSLLITAPIVAGVAASIGQAVSFESGLASVAKTTNLAGDDLKGLGENVADMANRMPFAREAILEVVAAAGRFGVANEDLLTFAEVALQLGTAAEGISAAKMTEELTKIATATNLPLDQIRPLADAIVALGNDFPTTEGQIAHFTQRLSQISATLPVGAADLAGIATGMLSVGIRAEAGGTATARAFNAINAAIGGGGEKLEKIAGIAGMTTDQFSQLFKEDPTQGFLAFLKGIRGIKEQGGDAAAVLKDLEAPFGDVRVRDAILRAANGYDVMVDAVETANDAFTEGGALQREYDKRVNTTAAQWEIFKNRASDAARVFGTALLPMLNEGLDALAPFFEGITLLAESFAALPEPMRKFIAGGLVLAAIMGPLVLIVIKLGTLFGALGSVLLLIVKPAGIFILWIGKMVLSLIILGARAIATALIVVGRLIWMAVTAVVQSAIFYTQLAVRMVAGWIVLGAQAVATAVVVVARLILMAVTAIAQAAIFYAQVAIRMVAGLLVLSAQAVLAGAIVVGRLILMAATAVAQAAIFYAQVAIRMVAGLVLLAAQTAINAAAVIGHFVLMGLGALAAAAQMALAWLIALGPWLILVAAIIAAVALIIIHWDTLKNATRVAWDWIKDKIGASIDFIIGKIEALKDAIASIPSIPGIGPVLGNAAKGVAGSVGNIAKHLIPGRAHGGPMMEGHEYRVNEIGQEFFVPGSSGAMVPATAGGSFTFQFNVDKMVIANDMDIVKTGRALAREADRELRAQGER